MKAPISLLIEAAQEMVALLDDERTTVRQLSDGLEILVNTKVREALKILDLENE